ncbi:MAG: L,D-transpeptidase family protein [Candidatus Limiplasma sp.]|nr:L,D-transpeptidase family protein [Candidatus Limiplasma sp.]
MRQKLSFLLVLIILLLITSVSSEGYLSMSVSPTGFKQGDSLYIYFIAPKMGNADLTVIDSNGVICATLLSDATVSEGANEFTWDGTGDGRMLAAGAYVLQLTMGDMSVNMDVAILPVAGVIATPSIQTADGLTHETEEETVEIGENPIAGTETVFNENQTIGTSMTPAYKSSYIPNPAHEACYWCTPMNLHDEAAIWAMLIAPITIVKGDNPDAQVILREEPSDDAKGVGVVTCLSQSVHVLETRDDGWSLVESYSSSFHDSKVKAWNLFVTGYIPSNKLAQKTPAQDYGLVVDKLTQELYLFKDGHLFSTLQVSTGLFNDKQPYNETRSGEFLTISRTGDIRSDNLIGSFALRFNSGDLLHEVPHVKNADGTKNFGYTEPKLGTRASHGCIRTQRLKNAEGVNMGWLWNNLSLYTKIVIWEDYAGRLMESPDPSTPLYFNTDGGTSYHSTPNCNGVRNKYLPLTGVLAYGELEDAKYKDLKRCPSCNPPRRIAEIEEINKIHETQSPGEIPQHLRQDK